MIKTTELFKRDLQIELDKIANYKVPGGLDKKVEAFEKKVKTAVQEEWLAGLSGLGGDEVHKNTLKEDIERMRSFEYEMGCYMTSGQRKMVHEKVEHLFRNVLGSLYGRGGIGGAPHGAANEMIYGYNRLRRITVDVQPNPDVVLRYEANKAPHQAAWQKAYKALYPKDWMEDDLSEDGQPDSHNHRAENPQAEAVIDECRLALEKLDAQHEAYIDSLCDSTHKWSSAHISIDDYHGWSFDIFQSPSGMFLAELSCEGDPEVYTIRSMAQEEFPTGALQLEQKEDKEQPKFKVFTDGQLVLKMMVHANDCRDESEISVAFNSVAEERAWWQDKVSRCWW